MHVNGINIKNMAERFEVTEKLFSQSFEVLNNSLAKYIRMYMN